MTSQNQVNSEPVQRIAKLIARAGLCSRREAERWIEAGRVTLNGAPIPSPAPTVSASAHIAVDGVALPSPDRPRLWRYHKPRGLLTTARDDRGRTIVFDRLPPDMPRVVAVGRLDLNSEGLLLLTNDGALARRLELPTNQWKRSYRVRVHGRVDPERLTSLRESITVDGQRYGRIDAQVERQQNSNAWLVLTLTEGRNREIRRIMDHFGWPVNRLIRIGYGPFRLGSLPSGQVAEAPGTEVRTALGQPSRKAGWARPRVIRRKT